MNLEFNPSIWKVSTPKADSTLQIFVTNKCDRRCSGCFYGKKLGQLDMDFEFYKKLVSTYTPRPTKIILIGGEPSIHPQINDMIQFNKDNGLKTTVYTNGRKLSAFKGIDETVKVRVGVMGLNVSEKPLNAIKPVDYPITMVYMLRMDNIHELYSAVSYAESNFNCKDIYISSIRELDKTGNFWLDTPDTISLSPSIKPNFSAIIQDFVNVYNGESERIHICRRGVIDNVQTSPITKCRYVNVFPDQAYTICPFDISLNITDGYIWSNNYSFFTRQCKRNHECILQKLVLIKKE